MSSITAAVVQMQAASLSQQVGTAVARQQFAAERAVADLVAGTAASAAPPAPPGQGKTLDVRV